MTQKSLQDAVGPPGMSDAVATMMGLKTYSHGTTYNGGIAPTISGATTIHGSSFIPYQMQDGAWRLRFNIAVAGATVASRDITVVGISAKTGPNYQTGCGSGLAADIGLVYFSGVNTISFVSTVASGGSTYVGDVGLTAKPTWAY